MGRKAKNIVLLTDEERSELLEFVKQGKAHGYKTKHAQILLALDENSPAERLSRKEISKVYQTDLSTVAVIAGRFVKGGLLCSLGRKEWLVPQVAAIARSEAPEGRERWTWQSIADELVRRGVVDRISSVTVGNMLRKLNLNPCEGNIKYPVTLTDEERNELLELVKRGKTQGYKIINAQILLKLDENGSAEQLSRAKICKAYQVCSTTVEQTAKRFAKGGIVSALGRQERVEAQVAAIARSEAPEGRERWTWQTIADELVRCDVVESISAAHVGKVLRKMNLNFVRKKYIVTLTSTERNELLELVKRGEQEYKIRHAQILLALDEHCPAERLSRGEISKTYRVSLPTISYIAERFEKEGMAFVRDRKEWLRPHIAAIVHSEAPEGRERWTWQTIADELVRRGVVERISADNVGLMLRKMNIRLGGYRAAF